MKFSDTYIPQWELDLATPEEIQVIKDHAEQQKIIRSLRKILTSKLAPLKRRINLGAKSK